MYASSLIRQRGLTLIEVILSMVVLGIGIAFFVSVFGASLQASADPMQRKQALAVAESMLNEIAAKPFANPSGGYAGASTQANRALFDDIGDYHGFATTGVHALDGGAVAALSGYDVTVSVVATSLGSGGTAVSAANARLITVTVQYGGGSVSLSAYRTAYAPDA